MDCRGVLLFLSVLGAGTLAAVACSAPDPGQITFSERPHQGVDPGSNGGSSGVASSSGGDTDAGGGDAGGAVDPVFGPDPFLAGQPGSQDSTQSPQHQGPGSPGATGQDCLQAGCHGPGGAGPQWTAGGTVYQQDGTTPAPEGVEVVLSDGNGKVLASVYTDKSGNFAVDTGTLATIPPGTRVGVRDATHTKGVMVAATTGACNSGGTCHGGTQGNVKLQ